MRIIGNNPAAENAEITAIASGTLADGNPVIVNSDGTVSVIVGNADSLGSQATFSATSVGQPFATFDTTNNKVVVTYLNSSNYIAVVIGTVSGSSISFGTPVIAESSNSAEPTVVFDSSNNKVVLTYRAGNNGKSVVGTVSGTSISFGTKTSFQSSGVEYTNSVFDSNSNKVIAIWSNDSSSKAGTAIVGTVSGTSISFGSPVVFSSRATQVSPAFDSTNNKIVICHTFFNGSSNTLEAVVGTVSGTSISFGSPVSSGFASSGAQLSMNDSTGQGVIGFRSGGSPYDGRAVSVTVSGTSISFGTNEQLSTAIKTFNSVVFDSSRNKFFIIYGVNIYPATLSGTDLSFESSSALSTQNIDYISPAFDNNDKLVLAYRNLTASQAGQSLVFTPASTNLTAENYIGFANGAAADTGTARVQIGGGINSSQSSLTAGQQYFVQTDGTIGLTAADPSVIAGTAISATEIIVKG